MRILVVEDEPAIREVEVAYLRAADFSVIETENGLEALRLFEAQKPDLIVIDSNIPGLDGVELCKRLRERSSVPIIFVTARIEDEQELRGLQSGADDYIKKPFNPEVLVARVVALLRRHAPESLQFGSLILDAARRTMTKHGAVVPLTTTQFNLLWALASHPGIVMTREQLLERAYEGVDEHFVYDRTVDAHIKSIRKRIEDDPTHPHYVQTVIGRGYRFMGDEL